MTVRKKNALGIGISNLEFTNIILTYYPKGLSENFDIYLFIDDTKVSVESIKNIIAEHNIPIWNNAEYIIINDVYEYYEKKHGYTGLAKEFLYTHGSLFKILMPLYLSEKFGVEKTYTSDDDVFIFGDLSNVFTDYKYFAYKKNTLFYLKGAKAAKECETYNQIFESDFKLEELKKLSLNSGNILYSSDPKLEFYFERFVKHPFVHQLFFDYTGCTSWTVEQRFQQFNLHRLIRDGHQIELLKSEDLRHCSKVVREEEVNDSQRLLKVVTPKLIHYAVGAQKPIFLRNFIKGISWKYDGFMYQPKYELVDILYDSEWKPEKFKKIYDRDKKHKKGILL